MRPVQCCRLGRAVGGVPDRDKIRRGVPSRCTSRQRKASASDESRFAEPRPPGSRRDRLNAAAAAAQGLLGCCRSER
jgi:hypothetical protein